MLYFACWYHTEVYARGDWLICRSQKEDCHEWHLCSSSPVGILCWRDVKIVSCSHCEGERWRRLPGRLRKTWIQQIGDGTTTSWKQMWQSAEERGHRGEPSQRTMHSRLRVMSEWVSWLNAGEKNAVFSANRINPSHVGLMWQNYSVIGGLGYYKGALYSQFVLSKDKLNTLTYFLKVRGEEQSVTNLGKLFHARDPATAKALSPSDERRVAGTTERMTMQTAVDGAMLLQQQAEWHLVG